MVFRLRAFLAAALILAAASMSFTPAQAAKGQFSIGGNFGTGIYSNGEFNDSLDAIGFDEVTSGFEYGGSIRYGMSEKVALDYEINFINGSATTDVLGEEFDVSTSAMAGPLSIYYLLSENDTAIFNLFVGAGPMFSTKYEVESSVLDVESASKTSFYAHAGLEAQWKLSPTFALTARALGRLAKASDVEAEDDPSDKIDIDLSGAAFSLGARVYFGGSAGN